MTSGFIKCDLVIKCRRPDAYLLSFGRLFKLEQRDVVHQGRVVEARMDEDLGDVDLLVPQRLGRRADVILAEPDLQDLADVGGEREAGNEATEVLVWGLLLSLAWVFICRTHSGCGTVVAYTPRNLETMGLNPLAGGSSAEARRDHGSGTVVNQPLCNLEVVGVNPAGCFFY